MIRLALVLLLSLLSCGGDEKGNNDNGPTAPPSRDEAVETSATKMCAWYASCERLNDIYASVGECESAWEGNFYDTWSADECTDDIRTDGLEDCHREIDALECDATVIDIGAIWFGECAEDEVCE